VTIPTATAAATLAPRDYQHRLIENARAAIRAGQRRILLVLPTGAGKTVVAAQIILGAVERSKRVLFLAHRSELISQASSKLDTLGVPHGIVQADHWRRRPYSPVQVASVQTLVNRQLAAPPDIVFIDECITGDAVVETLDGPFRIDDSNIVGRKALCFQESTETWVYRRILRWMNRGFRATLFINTAEGQISCTPEHLFLTNRGWLKAAALVQGDKILSPSLQCSHAKRSASYWERYWATRLSSTRTKEAGSLELAEFMDPSRKSGLDTKRGDSRSLTGGFELGKTEVMETSVSVRLHPAIQTSAQSINSSTQETEKRSTNDGLQPSQKRGWHGGIWTMVRSCIPATLHALISTAKGLISKAIRCWPNGCETSGKSPAKSGTQGEVFTLALMRRHLDAGLQCSENTASHQWHTNFVEVQEVQRGPIREVFDLEVEDEHNFVANGLLVHNCHRARSKSYVEIINRYPQATVIGLTATPIRSDGKGLGNLFSALIAGPTVAELTTQGYLVPTRVFAPNMPDLAGVRKTAGDYNQAGIQRAMDRPTITGDIVSHWQRLAENRLTVCFAAGIEHSQHLRDAFLAAGIAAAHLDGETDPTTRATLLADLAAGRIRVLCSVGVLTEGWDCPAVACAILARPTASTGLYLQMAGRILRPADEKIDALILDHAGCTLQHGFVDEDREWTLEHDRPLKPKPKIDLSIPKVCPTCYRVGSAATRKCPCGYVFSVTERGKPKQVSGDLQEITGSRAKWAKIPDVQRREMYLRWVEEGARQGHKAGFAGARYRAMFGGSPPLEWMLEASVAQPGYWRKQG